MSLDTKAEVASEWQTGPRQPRVEFETKTEAVEAEREDEKDPDEGITGVLARWRDVAAKTKKVGQEQAGATGTLKTLEHTYNSKQAAKQAALHA